jgi:hypothetical protein
MTGPTPRPPIAPAGDGETTYPRASGSASIERRHGRYGAGATLGQRFEAGLMGVGLIDEASFEVVQAHL